MYFMSLAVCIQMKNPREGAISVRNKREDKIF